MPTRERTIVEAVLTALQGVSGATVYEDRAYDLAVEQLPAVDVSVVGDEMDALTLNDSAMSHRLSIEVTVVSVSSPTASAHKRADPIVAAVHQAMMQGVTWPSGVMAISAGAVSVTRQSTGEGVVMRRVTTYEVQHQTAVTDLQTLPQ